MKPIFYFTLALFLGACGTKKQKVTAVVPKDTTPVVQKPTREDTLKALAIDPNDERYLHDYATTIETKEDGTQIITKRIVPKKTEQELIEEQKEYDKTHPKSLGAGLNDDPKPNEIPLTEYKKKFILNYYASEQFQKDSLRYANDVRISKRQQGYSDEDITKIIEQRIKNKKLNYEKP